MPFQEQESQLDETFPVRPYEYHNDRIFRHITFLEDEENIKLRLKAINLDSIVENTISVKKVPVGIPINDSQQEIFRVKAILSETDFGVEESYWLTQHNAFQSKAVDFNQYRIKGISDTGLNGDWVYSDIRDKENDLIVYNMLYDIIGLLTTAHDDQIDYLMDYVLQDTFIKMLKDQLPDVATSIDFDELKVTGIQEMINKISKMGLEHSEVLIQSIGEKFLSFQDMMKHELKETVFNSYQEFSDLYRLYHLFDQYHEKKQDVLSLLLEIFLKDRFEKIAQKSNLEVLLQNNEETSIYIKDEMNFNVKKEMIASIYNASPHDGFVSKLNDAVQLLSEPIIYENLVYQKDESVERFLRMALVEIYAPIVLIDAKLMEVEAELEDKHGEHIFSKLVEFSTMDEETELKYMLAYDIVETIIKGDLPLDKDYEALIMEYLLTSINDTKKSLLIDYHLNEVIHVLIDAGEAFRHEYKRALHESKERKHLSLKEYVCSDYSYQKMPLNERFLIAYKISSNLTNLKNAMSFDENSYLSFIEKALSTNTLSRRLDNESLLLGMIDSSNYKELNVSEDFSEETYLMNEDSFSFIDLKRIAKKNELMVFSQQEYLSQKDMKFMTENKEQAYINKGVSYYNLFKHYLKNPNKFPIKDDYFTKLTHSLRDHYIIDGMDVVNYALGSTDDNWPLGAFKLGSNTLRGEVSDA